MPVTPRVIAAFGFIRANGVATLERAIPLARFIFRLGNPNKVEGNTYTWFDGKPDPVAFTAIIENGVLTSVNCL